MTLCLLATPVLVCIVLALLQAITDSAVKLDIVRPASHALGPIRPCPGADCVTLLYAPDVPWVRNVLREAAARSNAMRGDGGNNAADQRQLDFARDFVPLPGASDATPLEWCLNGSPLVPADVRARCPDEAPALAVLAAEDARRAAAAAGAPTGAALCTRGSVLDDAGTDTLAFLPFAGKCYAGSGGRRETFDGAREYCAAHGGDLASIHGPGVNRFVARLAAGKKAWIGLREPDRDHEGRGWAWVDGQLPLGPTGHPAGGTPWTSWGGTEPNDYSGREDCAETNFRDHGRWNDQGCWARNRFVCERPCPMCNNNTATQTEPGGGAGGEEGGGGGEDDDDVLPWGCDPRLYLPCGLVRDNATMTGLLLDVAAGARPPVDGRGRVAGRVQNAVLFQSAYVYAWGARPPDAKTGYVLSYNESALAASGRLGRRFVGRDEPDQFHVLRAMRAIDEALLSLALEQRAATAAEEASTAEGPDTPRRGVTLDVAWKRFPSPPRRAAMADLVGATGAVWFFVPAAAAMYVLLTDVVAEKEAGLRLALRVAGARRSAYWAAHALAGVLAPCAAVSALLVLAGNAFRFTLFTRSAPAVLFALYFAFACAMCAMGAFVSAFVRRAASAQTAGFALVLVGFVFQARDNVS